jgi:hypothetical protein
MLVAMMPGISADDMTAWKPKIPKVWDEAALREWATPLAGLNVRPSHISEAEYYRWPVEDLRSYPVYYPGREPAGYWEMLQYVGPKPLLEPRELKTEVDWIAAGRRVFEESDAPQLRSQDPDVIAKVRSREFYEAHNANALPDGTMDILRSVPTKEGVAVSTLNCSGCHVLHRSDGTAVGGAQARRNVAEQAVEVEGTAGNLPRIRQSRSFGRAAVLHGERYDGPVVVPGLECPVGEGRCRPSG